MSELTDRLVEAAARAIALAANEGEDWPVRDEDRHDAREVLRAVLPLLAEVVETAPQQSPGLAALTGVDGCAVIAAVLREAQP